MVESVTKFRRKYQKGIMSLLNVANTSMWHFAFTFWMGLYHSGNVTNKMERLVAYKARKRVIICQCKCERK